MRLFPEVVQLRCHNTGMFLTPTRERHLGCWIQKKSCLKLSKYKADTFDMIQNAVENNNMDKAMVYKGTKREKVLWRVLAWKEEMQKKSTKTPQTVDTIESFSNRIHKGKKCLKLAKNPLRGLKIVQTCIRTPEQELHFSKGLMIFDDFDICYGAANKVVKQDQKNGKDLNKIFSKEVLEKDTNLFAEMQITIMKTFEDPFYNKGFPSFDFLRLPSLQNTLKWINFQSVDKIFRL